MQTQSLGMNAIQLLKQQHQDVRDLFELFEKASDSTDKDRICQQLANNLAAHMTIEEQIFYPAAFDAVKDESQRQEAFSEHQEAKEILAEVLDMDMSLGGQNFEERIHLLRQKIEHHVREEEDVLLERVREVMDRDELKRLGEEMKILFTQEMAGEPSESLLQGTGSTRGTQETQGSSEASQT
jgi:hemerythrin-like domain-containing protein